MNKMIANRYMVITSLGEGGMADVYLAVDTILNREVAIKILRGELSSDPVTLLRFQREANAVSKLNHPNVVDVYDVGEYGERHYIVMEYIRGRTLKQLISQRGALHCEEAVNIMVQLVKAVEHAHENNIIHRDIKPQNIMVKDDGTIKIMDFGIALAHDAVQLTQSDAVLGSAHYLAPETTRGEAPTNQVDIYALGIVFYELLTGTVPYTGDNPVQIAMKHLREEIPCVKEFNPTIPQSVENIILKATVKNRNYRYQSAQEMMYDLDHCLMAEYRDVEKLSFEETKEPTIVMNGKAKTGKQHSTKEQTTDNDEKQHKRRIAMIVILASLICNGVTCLLLVVGGVFKNDKLLVVPDVENISQRDAIQTLANAGFDTSKITYKEELHESIEKGNVINIDPGIGSETKKSTNFTITLSKGVYYIIEDYTYQLFRDVKAELEKSYPKLEIKVEYSYDVEKKAGYIVEQKGHIEGDKLDPEVEDSITFVVTAKPSMMLENIIGREVEEIEKELKAKGFVVVIRQLSTADMSEEEIEKLKRGRVVKTDPKEGTRYTQEGDTTYITLFYY